MRDIIEPFLIVLCWAMLFYGYYLKQSQDQEYVNAFCSDLHAELIRRGIQPTEFHCEYIGDKK